MKRVLILFGTLLLLCHALHAAVRLHGLFADNMVLQQGATVPVWGTAEDGEEVTATLCGQTKTTTARAGKWQVTFDALPAGGPHTLMVRGANTLEVKNVLIGEVWICSGQSNMWRRMDKCFNGEAEIAAAADPLIRHVEIPAREAPTPQTDVEAVWKVCEPAAAKNFSATAYFFARALSSARKVPVGIILAAWNGTRIEPWTRPEALMATEEQRAVAERYAAFLAPHLAAYEKEVSQWKQEKAKAAAAGTRFSARMPRRSGVLRFPSDPGVLYNGMIAPLMPFAIAGGVWYQGESNVGRARDYAVTFPAMIQSWRSGWGQGEFPFLWAQLASFHDITTSPATSSWAELRNSQSHALTLPRTAMAVLTDLGDEVDVHPSRKAEAGKRLALAARAIAYGETLAYSGPAFKAMERKGRALHLTFAHTGSGLTVRGDGINPTPESWPDRAVKRDEERLAQARKAIEEAKEAHARTPDDDKARNELARCIQLATGSEKKLVTTKKLAADVDMKLRKARKEGLDARKAADKNSILKGFMICGSDREFVWAHAEIVGTHTVVVSSQRVPEPVAVRYAWEDYPICNLYNEEGLPAIPFRTDDFPLSTAPETD